MIAKLVLTDAEASAVKMTIHRDSERDTLTISIGRAGPIFDLRPDDMPALCHFLAGYGGETV